MKMARPGFVMVCLVCALMVDARAEDWPRWRGPDLNGISKESNWFKPWPKEGPRRLWKGSVGGGYSTLSVASGRVFTCGSVGKKETIYCLDEETGKTLWKHTYTTKFVPQFYEGGSSGTPAVNGDRAYY